MCVLCAFYLPNAKLTVDFSSFLFYLVMHKTSMHVSTLRACCCARCPPLPIRSMPDDCAQARASAAKSLQQIPAANALRQNRSGNRCGNCGGHCRQQRQPHKPSKPANPHCRPRPAGRPAGCFAAPCLPRVPHRALTHRALTNRALTRRASSHRPFLPLQLPAG